MTSAQIGRAKAVLPSLPVFCASIVLTIAAAVLIGWTLEIEPLKRLMPSFVAMDPTTAICLALGAVALALHEHPASRLAATMVTAVASLKLAQLALGLGGGIDEMLFAAALSEAEGRNGLPNRMAPHTAFALFVLGVALLATSVRGQRTPHIAQALSGVVAAISLFALIGYLFGLVPLYGVERHKPMALHTAVSLLILTLGVFSARPQAGLMRILRDEGPAGELSRAVLPLAVLIPVAIGLARVEGQRAGLYGTETGIALQVIANVLVTFLLLLGIIIALFRTDTLRRQREIAVSQSEARYRLAEQVASVGHWRMELPSKELDWSDQVYQITGWSRADGIPTTSQVLQLYHPDYRDKARAAVVRALKTGEGWDFVVRLLRPDGEVHCARSIGVVEQEKAGKVPAIFGVFADVTDLEQARHAAEAATEEKAAFLANMSHEIRTPLNSIIGFTDLLMAEGVTDPKQMRQLELVQNSGYALLTVVNDILDFSKIEAGKVELRREVFALETFVDNTVSIIHGAATAKGLEVRVNIDRALSLYHCGDEGRLRQVLLNLLNNAVKFTASGFVTLDVVRTSGDAARERLRITVTDTGVGVAEEKQTRLFQQFSQADASISREYGGTGLGLAISKRLIELMEGDIGFASTEGCGSTFWFEVALPIGEKPSEPAATAAAACVRSASILVVEDLPMNQELACAILERAGHQVDVANDGGEAVLAVQAKRYDLVLMDIQMPKVDGITATRMIRALDGPTSLVPIVAMTANVLPEQVKEFSRVGMNGHIAKPINQPALHAEIARALSNAPPGPPPVDGAPAALGFDAVSFASVRDMLPAERLQTHLASFEQQVRDLTEEAEPQALKVAAHKLVSQAGMLGFMVLSEKCRALEQACDFGSSVEEALTDARAAANATLAMLPALRAGQLPEGGQ